MEDIPDVNMHDEIEKILSGEVPPDFSRYTPNDPAPKLAPKDEKWRVPQNESFQHVDKSERIERELGIITNELIEPFAAALEKTIPRPLKIGDVVNVPQSFSTVREWRVFGYNKRAGNAIVWHANNGKSGIRFLDLTLLQKLNPNFDLPDRPDASALPMIDVKDSRDQLLHSWKFLQTTEDGNALIGGVNEQGQPELRVVSRATLQQWGNDVDRLMPEASQQVTPEAVIETAASHENVERLPIAITQVITVFDKNEKMKWRVHGWDAATHTVVAWGYDSQNNVRIKAFDARDVEYWNPGVAVTFENPSVDWPTVAIMHNGKIVEWKVVEVDYETKTCLVAGPDEKGVATIRRVSIDVIKANNDVRVWDDFWKPDSEAFDKNLQLQIEGARSPDVLFALLQQVPGVHGSEKFYTSEELIQIIQLVLAGKAPVTAVTRSMGLRHAVEEIIKHSQEQKSHTDHEKSRVESISERQDVATPAPAAPVAPEPVVTVVDHEDVPPPPQSPPLIGKLRSWLNFAERRALKLKVTMQNYNDISGIVNDPHYAPLLWDVYVRADADFRKRYHLSPKDVVSEFNRIDAMVQILKREGNAEALKVIAEKLK